ncbi:MAG TPA: glycosyltransferase [Thermoanaerobaculia bacterium]|nr:glycosyltransferase [Thermoanaerobaculia bacterium]
MRSPAVSIVMPVFRPHPRHFGEAIDSILAQTFTDWELVVVEDPSDRPGAEVIAARADPRIRHLRNETRTSLPRQHNRAVAEARAALVARFDADDISEPQRLEKQVRYLEDHPDVDVVASQLTIIDDAGRVIGARDYPTTHEAIVRAMHRYNPISGSNAMFRRRVVDAVGGWREHSSRPAQDYEWYSRVASRGFRFAILPERLVRYRVHTDQIKHRQLRGTILTSLEVRRRYWFRSMDFRSRLQLVAEHAAPLLPMSLALALYRGRHYRAAPASPDDPREVRGRS